MIELSLFELIRIGLCMVVIVDFKAGRLLEEGRDQYCRDVLLVMPPALLLGEVTLNEF